MNHARILFIPAAIGLPAPFLIVDRDGRVVGRGALDPERVDKPVEMRTIAVVPGADVLIRWLDLPGGRPAQVRTAARWALRDQTAADAEGLDIALGAVVGEGRPRLTTAVSAKLLQAWLGWLETFDIRADAVVPDCLCLPEPEVADGLIAARFGADVGLRGQGLAIALQPDMVEAVAAGRTVAVLEGEALEAALVAGAVDPVVDLLQAQDRRDRAQTARGWRIAAALAAALLLSPLILAGAGAGRDHMAADRAEAAARAGALKLHPDLVQTADPVEESLRRLNSGPPPGGLVRAAAAAFAIVETVQGTELEEASAKPADGAPGGLRLVITHSAFADLEAIRDGFGAAGLALTDEATVEEDGRMVSTLAIGGAR